MYRLLVCCVLAAGCQPRAVSPTLPPPPPLPPSAGVAEAAPAAPTGDPVLDTTLARLAADIDRHAWARVSARLADGVLEQATADGVAAGLSGRDAHARAVGRALGLGTLVAVPNARAALDRIRVVTLRTVYAINDDPDVTVRVEGDVRLTGGQTLPLTVEMRRVGEAYRLVMPRVAPDAPPNTRVEAALPSVPGDPDRMAAAQPVAPTGDDELDAFLSGFAAAMDRHDWRGVAARSDARLLDARVDADRADGDTPRQAAARALARLMGLDGIAADAAPFERLDAVRVITLRSVMAINDLPGARYLVEGDLRFAGGDTLPMTLYVDRVGLGGSAYAATRPAGGSNR